MKISLGVFPTIIGKKNIAGVILMEIARVRKKRDRINFSLKWIDSVINKKTSKAKLPLCKVNKKGYDKNSSKKINTEKRSLNNLYKMKNAVRLYIR